MSVEGGCHCRAVRFRLREMPEFAVNCHCSICRHVHGAAYGSFAVVNQSDFTWLQGEHTLSVYRSSPGFQRFFCPTCGSPLTVLEAWNPEGITVVLAALDEPHPLRPQGHIFAASKASWHDIIDALPQHPAWPPGIGPVTA